MSSKRKSLEGIEEVKTRLGFSQTHYAALLSLDKEDLILLLADLATLRSVDIRQVKKARGLPSFSSARYKIIAEEFNLPALTPENTSRFYGLITEEKVTECFLPPSFHRSIFPAAWRTLDVYRDPKDQTREAAKVRILEPYMTALLGLFQGRVIDTPEAVMPETEYSTGGEVEHEVFVIGGVLFFVVEFKMRADQADHLAQLFLELLSAAQYNAESVGFPELRVYGLLTDLERFDFYSYNPMERSFKAVNSIFVGNLRDSFCYGMINVTNAIFSIVMNGYIEAVSASHQRSSERAACDDVSETAWSNLTVSQRDKILSTTSKSPSVQRKSTILWDRVSRLAKTAQSHFQGTDVDELEINGKQGLKKLRESLMEIPRFHKLLIQDDPNSPEDLEALAIDYVAQWHENNIKLNKPLAHYSSRDAPTAAP